MKFLSKYEVPDKFVRYGLLAFLVIIVAFAFLGCSKKEEPVPPAPTYAPEPQAYAQPIQQVAPQPQIVQQAPAPIIIQNAPAPAPQPVQQVESGSSAMTTLLAAGAGAYVGSRMAQPDPAPRYDDRRRSSYYEPRRAPTVVRKTVVVNNYVREPKSSPKPSTSFRVDPPRPKVDLSKSSKPKKSSTSCNPPYCTR